MEFVTLNNGVKMPKVGFGVYRIKDHKQCKQAVLDAIAIHTTGKPEMTTLEKIIYVADYIEPNRNKAPKLALLRMMAFQDLDECLLEILENTLIFLTSTDSEIDEITVKTYEYYKKIRKPDR